MNYIIVSKYIRNKMDNKKAPQTQMLKRAVRKGKIDIKAKIVLLNILVLCRLKKVSDDDILGFMCITKGFKDKGYWRYWILLNRDGSERAYIWNKFMLGGWRISLQTDKPGEWQERGPIKTVTQLKTFLEK